MNPYEILLRSINFANNELENFKVDKELQDNLSVVLSSLFRKIIELSDGVRVCAENGLSGPAELNYRGLIEVYLAFKYIIENPEHAIYRANAYKIGYHKHQIEAAQYALNNNNLIGDKKTLYEAAIAQHTAEMDKAELGEVLEEYNRLQSNDRRGFIPKWYSLYGGPKSINQLAKKLEENRDKDQNLMAMLYSFLSTGAHNYLALRDIFMDVNGKVSLKKTIYAFDPNVDHYNLIPTRSLLTSSIMSFTNIIYPEYIDHFRDFAAEIRGSLSY